MGNSAFILNHQVMLKANPNHGAIGRSRLLYIANRPGVVIEKTPDQIRMEQNNERMVKLGYIGYRPGVETNRELHHGLFDQHGIPSRAKIARELVNTDSAVITSVLSIRREDAFALNLQTRQDWERLLRSYWNKHIESLGVMEPQKIRWVAAFHTNQVNNLHVHVFSWDESGQFNSLLPRKNLVSAHDTFMAEVLKPYQEKYNLVRTQTRDDLVFGIRTASLDEEQHAKLIQMLPADGSLKYAHIAKNHPQAKKVIDESVNQLIERNPSLNSLKEQYLDVVLEHARLKPLKGVQLEAYVHAAKSDLNTRLGNALITQIKGELISGKPEYNLQIVEKVGASPLSLREEKAAAALFEEMKSNLTPKELNSFSLSICNQDILDTSVLRKLPTIKAYSVKNPDFVGVLSSVSSSMAYRVAGLVEQSFSSQKLDASDEAAQMFLKTSCRVLYASIRKALSVPRLHSYSIPKISISERI